MKLDLSDVTLCAADSANLALTARALQVSTDRCKFAEAVLFSHERLDGDFRTVIVPKFDRIGYQAFRIKPPPTVDTPFTLFIEWDGYVLEPRAWDSSFREYDYIGARWPGPLLGVPGRTVGNSGFCLQSKKLNAALADPRFAPAPEDNVDALVCGKYRPILEQEFGIRFAPEPVADRFSYELLLPVAPTFGFHGMSNMWRYVDDDKMVELVALVDPYVFRGPQFIILILNYALQCKFAMVEQLYAQMRKHVPFEDAAVAFRVALKQPHADAIFGLCEQLTAPSFGGQGGR
jgi:hypothetical protein